MKIIIAFVVAALCFVSCKENNEVDPELVGTWTDGFVKYHFTNGETYYQLYLNNGDSLNTVKADSVWGTYLRDKSHKKVTLYQKGYRLRSTKQLIEQSLNATTWQYSISGDKLVYTSVSAQGVLKKAP